MTYKEALEKVTECGLNIEEPLHSEVIELVKAALEKQIPKKTTECGEDWFVCPNCETNIITLDELETHSFCLVCGQALDWSDTE